MLLDIGGQAESEYAQRPELSGLTEQLKVYRERLAQSGHRVPAVETKVVMRGYANISLAVLFSMNAAKVR